MPWPFTPGEVLTDSNLEAVTIPWNAVCQMKRTAAIALANNTATVINWTSTILDPLTWFVGGGTPSRILPTIAGWYQATCHADWQSDTDYTRLLIAVLKNGAAIYQLDGPGRAGSTSQAFVTPLFQLNGSTDYVELSGLQVNTSVGNNTIDPTMTVRLVYPT